MDAKQLINLIYAHNIHVCGIRVTQVITYVTFIAWYSQKYPKKYHHLKISEDGKAEF